MKLPAPSPLGLLAALCALSGDGSSKPGEVSRPIAATSVCGAATPGPQTLTWGSRLARVPVAGARARRVLSAWGDTANPAGEAPEKLPECIAVKAVVRYGAAGYDHWVQVANHCEAAVACQVATDVNPEPQAVRVQAGKTEEVLTYRGSPASEFEPRVACTLETPSPGGKGRQVSRSGEAFGV